ncbi:MAG TPA: carbohydrate kinase family protein [Anaerolineales bacterium]|nr:carbohydrate kinase family protein [Anaerolineales bacterium]
MNNNVVFVSNAVIDISVPIASFPIHSGKHQSTVDQVVITPGGNATTLFCGACLGLQMTALGNLGNDPMGSLWTSSLTVEGVDVSQMIISQDYPTSVTIVPTTPDGQHVFLGASKSRNSGPSVFSREWSEIIMDAGILLLDGWSYKAMGPEVNEAAIEVANDADVSVFFDPGPEILNIPRSWTKAIISSSKVVLLTYEEAEHLTQVKANPDEMTRIISDMGPDIVLLKLGPEGIVGRSSAEIVRQSGFNVTVRDTTGAGDSLLASVAFTYLHGYSFEEMVTLANGTGAACVQKLGAGVHAPSTEEILQVLTNSGINFSLKTET